MSTNPTTRRFTGEGRRGLTAWLAVAPLLLLVTVVGGYAGHWKWTGFQANDTLWDWLNLVLLPVTLAVVPLWPFLRRRNWVTWRLLFVFLLAAFVAVLIGGYVGHWRWTGFAGNTLWDWLKLLLVPFVVPPVISAVSHAVAESHSGPARPGEVDRPPVSDHLG